MLRRLVRRQLDAFERRWSYDMTYGRELLDQAGLGTLLPLNGLAKLSAFRRDVPVEAYYGAKITTAIAADCGPCAQLVVDEALHEGLDPAVVRALVEGRRELLPEPARLGRDLARAVLDRDGGGETARAEILRRWGRAGLASVAYGIVAAQAFPTLKYALGHGRACVRVRIGDADAAPRVPAPQR